MAGTAFLAFVSMASASTRFRLLPVVTDIHPAIASLAMSFTSRVPPDHVIKKPVLGKIHLIYIFGHVPSCLPPVSFVQHHTLLSFKSHSHILTNI